MMRFDTLGLTARWLPFAALTALAAVAGLGLIREVTWTRPMPPMPVVEEGPPPTRLLVLARDTLGGPVETAHYAVIAVRNLFSASRGERAENTVTASTAPSPKLFLHGVVVDGASSRAYIEDPDTQRVFGYALGDAVGGGKLVRILDDRVVIRRPDGLVEIMLRDPAKPQPAPPGAPGPAAPEPAAPTPGAPAAPVPAPGAEAQTPVTPPQGAK
jgi:hypothetical protein